MKKPARQPRMRICGIPPRLVLFTLLLAATAASGGCGGDPRVNSLSASVVVQDKAVMKFIRSFAIGVAHMTTKKKASVACADFPSKYRTVKHPDLRFQATRQISWSGQEGAATEVLKVTPDQPYIVVVEGLAPYNSINHVVARGCKERVQASNGVTTTVEVDVRATAGRPCTNASQCEHSLPHCLAGDGFPAQGYCTVSNCAADEQCPPGTKCLYVGNGQVCAAVCQQPEDCETGNGVSCVRGLGPGGCHGACLKPSSSHQSC